MNFIYVCFVLWSNESALRLNRVTITTDYTLALPFEIVFEMSQSFA